MIFIIFVIAFTFICLWHGEEGAIIPGLIGICILSVLLFFLNNPDIFKVLLVIAILLGVVVGVLSLIQDEKNRQEDISATEKRKAQREQDKVAREKAAKEALIIRAAYVSDLQAYGEKHGFLTNGDSSAINGLVLLNAVMDKYSSQIKNDYHKTTAADQYGRVTDKQLDDWRWHLLEIVDTCKLETKADKLRNLLRQIILWRTNTNFEVAVEQFDEAYLKIEILREYQKSPDKIDSQRMRALKLYQNILFTAFSIYIKQEDSSVFDRFDEIMTGIDFEYFCSEILNESGWSTNVLPRSGDHGADILAELSGMTVVIQCKKYSKPLGNTPIQEITAARHHYKADKAFVVTNSTYTKGAQTLAKSNDVELLHYTDLTKLIEYMQSKTIESPNEK